MSDQLCQFRAGVIIASQCGREAEFQCPSCGLWVCSNHTSFGASTDGVQQCRTCALLATGKDEGTGESDGDSTTDSDSWYSRRDSDSWQTDRSHGNNLTDEDYAAFDETSNFDRDFDKDGSFDS